MKVTTLPHYQKIETFKKLKLEWKFPIPIAPKQKWWIRIRRKMAQIRNTLLFAHFPSLGSEVTQIPKRFLLNSNLPVLTLMFRHWKICYVCKYGTYLGNGWRKGRFYKTILVQFVTFLYFDLFRDDCGLGRDETIDMEQARMMTIPTWTDP